MLIKLVDQY